MPWILRNPLLLLLLWLCACGAKWTPLDADGDGWTPDDGDCWDAEVGPSDALGGADIHPGAEERWYDGIDQDCAGDDDYDADHDGWIQAAHVGLRTLGVPGSGRLPGGDCWDNPGELPQAFTVVSSARTDRLGDPLAWAQPLAVDVHPGAEDTWYDGVDQDCVGDDDFDRDRDGWATWAYPNRDGVFGRDCMDDNALDAPSPTGKSPVDVNPGAAEVWYDGTDDDCDGNDCDQDGDGYARDGATPFDEARGYCPVEECDDSDASVYPDAAIAEVWYNGTDDNCDGNDGDRDGDGYWVADYEERVRAAKGRPLPVPAGWEGDCDDDDTSVHPGADELCDEIDADCDGDPADADALDASTFFADTDADGHGDADAPTRACDAPPGFVASADDCDDANAAAYPGARELVADGVDEDCDGRELCYQDLDRDGYGTSVTVASTDLDCLDAGESRYATDCLDSNAYAFPGAAERESTSSCREDADSDGYGDESPPAGVVAGGDCDDSRSMVNPGVTSDGATLNLVDEDCDDYLDEDAISYGSVVITEIAKHVWTVTSGPDNPDAHWFEVKNLESFSISLANWRIRACSTSGFLSPSTPGFDSSCAVTEVAISSLAGSAIVLEPGGRLVLCQNDAWGNLSSTCDYEMGGSWSGSNPEGIPYRNSALAYGPLDGLIEISLDGSVVDQVGWYYVSSSNAWPYLPKKSTCLDAAFEDADLNDDKSHWGNSSTTTWSSSPSNFGTPGSENRCTL